MILRLIFYKEMPDTIINKKAGHTVPSAMAQALKNNSSRLSIKFESLYLSAGIVFLLSYLSFRHENIFSLYI